MRKSLFALAIGLIISTGSPVTAASALNGTAGNNFDADGVQRGKGTTTDFDIVVDANFDKKADWRELIRKIQIQDRRFLESRGGVDLGGGSSVIDPKTGKRVLLDLAEEDAWSYADYIPVSFEYLRKFSNELAADNEWVLFESLKYYWTDAQLIAKKRLLMGIAGSALVDVHAQNGRMALIHFKEELKNQRNQRIQDFLDQRIDQTGRAVRWMFVDVPLSQLNDEGYIRLLDPTTKRQVAIQKDGIVVIQRDEFNQLDNESKAALFLHEGILFSVLTLKPEIIKNQGTAPVRKLVRRTLAYERVFYRYVADRTSVDTATLINYHLAIEDAVRELINLGL